MCPISRAFDRDRALGRAPRSAPPAEDTRPRFDLGSNNHNRSQYTVETEAVANLIRNGLPGADVKVDGDGSHFEAVVISSAFEGLSPIKKQRLVMDTVKPQIASGELHALSIKALTPEQVASA
jgi:acid stress-induced BolA-like protein IbaG/YrbA